ncbi:MAG: hypothetical protein HY619_06680 [Thaumarchaeota archaeon]|nr:hypothetical protein [Nitrososphaerota archaeon]
MELSTIIGLALAVAVGVLVYGVGRRWVTIPQGFNYIDYLTGGAFPEGSVIMLDGDAASGRSDIAQAMLNKMLSGGKALAVLYDIQADEYFRRAERNGYSFPRARDATDLVIIDCLSPLMKGSENELLRDPYNLTYVNIAINDDLNRFKGKRYVLVLDSVLPLLNRLSPNMVIDFIQALSLRVRDDRGIFLLCSASQSIGAEHANRMASMVDGVIETRSHHSFGWSRKSLTVKWIRDRKLPTLSVRFDSVVDKGIVFRLAPR